MTTATRHIHWRDDFFIRETFRDSSGAPCPLPHEVDFVLTYHTKHGHSFIASRIAGVYSNCTPDGDALLVIFKDHGLCEGTLRRDLRLSLLNDLMPGGIQNVYYPADLNVQLWHLPSDASGVLESDLLAAYTRGLPFTFADFTPQQLADLKGDKGDPFTFADFTPAQIADLKRPATEAANLAGKATDAANKASAAASSAATSATNAAKLADTATSAANVATTSATNAATNANAMREQLEQLRASLDITGERAERAAAPVPHSLRVPHSLVVTLGNPVPRYIGARLLPASALQNIIYQAFGGAAGVEPDGKILPFRPGIATVHVIPTNATTLYKSVAVQVVAPSLRISGSVLRLDRAGNIRLT